MWVALCAWATLLGAGPASAQDAPTRSVQTAGSVLVTPVQGTEALRTRDGDSVAAAVRDALQAQGYAVILSRDLLGRAVVACRTPECVEQALDAAGAAFAIVPAIWSARGTGAELTLTLVRREGRSLNVSAALGEDLRQATADLLDSLLQRRTAAQTRGDIDAAHPDPASTPTHPNAWKAGPVLLITGSAAAFLSVGVAAGVKSESQQLRTGAVAAWSALGALALGGGISWWVVGQKRRRQQGGPARAFTPSIAFRPSGIDLRLRF